jgi:hypothetical protein
VLGITTDHQIELGPAGSILPSPVRAYHLPLGGVGLSQMGWCATWEDTIGRVIASSLLCRPGVPNVLVPGAMANPSGAVVGLERCHTVSALPKRRLETAAQIATPYCLCTYWCTDPYPRRRVTDRYVMQPDSPSSPTPQTATRLRLGRPPKPKPRCTTHSLLQRRSCIMTYRQMNYCSPCKIYLGQPLSRYSNGEASPSTATIGP